MWKSFALEPHGEWSEFANECIGLLRPPVFSWSCYRHSMSDGSHSGWEFMFASGGLYYESEPPWSTRRERAFASCSVALMT
jgi:hypothetical protein